MNSDIIIIDITINNKHILVMIVISIIISKNENQHL